MKKDIKFNTEVNLISARRIIEDICKHFKVSIANVSIQRDLSNCLVTKYRREDKRITMYNYSLLGDTLFPLAQHIAYETNTRYQGDRGAAFKKVVRNISKYLSCG